MDPWGGGLKSIADTPIGAAIVVTANCSLHAVAGTLHRIGEHILESHCTWTKKAAVAMDFAYVLTSAPQHHSMG
jgi:hypothetical protein